MLMTIETTIKVKHLNCEFTELSQEINTTQFFTYCNGFFSMILTDGEITNEDLRVIEKKLKVPGKVKLVRDDESRLNYIIIQCKTNTCNSGVMRIIQKNFGITINPVKYYDGFEIHKFICINKTALSEILNEISNNYDLKLISTNEKIKNGPFSTYGISISQYLENLTDEQLSTILLAFKNGYYQIPRNTRLIDIAKEFGITRQAVEKRIRRAENSIMELVLPMIDFEQVM